MLQRNVFFSGRTARMYSSVHPRMHMWWILIGIVAFVVVITQLSAKWRIERYGSAWRDAFDDRFRYVWVLGLEDEVVRGEGRGMDFIRKNLAENGLGNAEAIAAVDGRFLTDADMRSVEPSLAKLGKGVVGCYLSHVNMWERAASIKYDDELVLILEDDVKVLRHVSPKPVPRGFDVVYLGHLYEEKNSPEVAAGFRKSINPVTTRAYVITPRSARKLLKAHTRRYAVDVELIQLVRSGKISAASAIPPWIDTLDTRSSIARVSGCKGRWVGHCIDE